MFILFEVDKVPEWSHFSALLYNSPGLALTSVTIAAHTRLQQKALLPWSANITSPHYPLSCASHCVLKAMVTYPTVEVEHLVFSFNI